MAEDSACNSLRRTSAASNCAVRASRSSSYADEVGGWRCGRRYFYESPDEQGVSRGRERLTLNKATAPYATEPDTTAVIWSGNVSMCLCVNRMWSSQNNRASPKIAGGRKQRDGKRMDMSGMPV